MRPKRLVAAIAGGLLVLLLAAIGVYYLAFRPLPTTVSWAPSVSAIAPGVDLVVSGRVTPAESGRQVLLESALKPQGPWQPMRETATTDGRGRFAVAFKPQFTGLILIRTVVDPAGRHLEVTGQSRTVRLLASSSISLKGAGTIPTGTPLDLKVILDPPSAGRTVRIERSSDKVRWVPVGSATRTKSNGIATVTLPTPPVGVWSFRATAAQNDEFAAAVSPLAGVTIEDIKAAAARYLRVTKKFNAAVHAFNKNVTPTLAPVVPARWRSAAGVLSAASTKAAAELKEYGSWPMAVKPLIDKLIAQYAIEADNDHQLSAATTFKRWNSVSGAANDEGVRLSTLVRQALGLPQRAIE